MQWTNKVKYQGQVKTAGIGKQMSWKTGFVDFDYDEIRDKWMVKLTFNVNPNRVFHQLQIGHSDSLAVKCGRLMIENKKGDGIHIKLSSDDIDHARQLIAKIQRPAIKAAGQHNRAQVGITSTPSSKISENINPHLNGSLSSDSSPQLSSNDVSPIELENWLPKKTPSSGAQKHPTPVSQRQTEATRSNTNPTPSKPPPSTLSVSSKRRLEYSGAQNNSGSKQNNMKNVYDDADDLLDEIDLTPKRFTAMKAHPKSRAQQGPNTLTPGLGTRRFYGSQSTVMKDKFPRDGNSIALAADRSPRIKRAKLTSDLDSNQENYLSGNSPSLGGHNVKMASSGSAEDYSNAEGDSAAQITVGFDNLGNTCFMNSPLQCLSSLEPLSIDFQTAVAEFGPELRPNSITRLLYLLMKDVRKLDVCPERVRQILVRLRHDINGKFALNTQQDAHELLAELLDRTDEEVKAVMGARQAHSDMASGSAGGAPSTILADSGASSGTPIQSNFMWFYKTSFYFHECKTEITSSQEERDTTLMLALNSDKDYSLQDCIDRYFESSEVEMKCDKCGKDEKATMTRKIVKRPRIFILNLLRYQTDITESKKKMDKVNIPRYMSIAEYCADDVKAPPYMEPVFMLDREEVLQFSYGDSSFMPAQPDISAITRRMKRRQEGALSKHQVSFSPVLLMDNNNEDNLMSPNPPVDGLETTPSSPLNTAGLFPFDESYQNFGSINCDLDSDLLAGKFSDPVPKVIVTDLLEPEKNRLAAWTPWRAQNQLLCPGDGQPKPLCIVKPKNGSNSGLLMTSNPALNLNEALLSNTMMMQPLTISTDGECFGPSTSSTPDMPMLVNLNHLPYDVETESDPFSPNNPMYSNKFDDSLPTRDCDMDFPMCADDTQHMDQNMSNTLPQEGGHGQDSRHFSFSEKEKPDEVTDGAGQRNGTADDCGADVGVDKKAGDSEHQSKGQNTRLSKGRKVVLSVPDDVQDTKLLVKTLISKFWEVENYIQEYGEEAAMLYVETSAVITEVNSRIERQRKVTEPTNDESGSAANQSDHSPTHQVAVCHLLMNLALGSDEDEIETALDDDHCEMICKDIFLTRYSSYDKEDKKRDHLIENLCLYLAAKKLGIAKPDTPKKTMRSPEAARAGHSTDRVEWKDQSQAESPVDSMVNSPESDDEISFKSLPSKDTEGCAVVDEKRKTEHSQSENLGESSSGNRIITVTSVMPKGREKHRDESKVAGSLAVSTSHHVRAVPAQQEHQYFGLPNVPNFNLIQDRDFSCYTEEELQSVDLASLTEDEMMQYAQALSKLQYVRDQKAKPDDDCPMELCDLSQDEAMSPNISDLANECDHLSEVLQDSSSLGPSPSGMKLTTERNQSSSHTAAVLQQSVFSDACVPTIKEMASTQGNEQPNEVQLTCEENLSDLDEPDGLVQIDTPLIKDYYKSKDVVKTDIKNSLKCHSTPARDDYYYDYGMLNQADFGSQPMDMNMSFPESQSLFCDTPSEAKSERQSPKVLLDKCNTSSENGKSHKKISRLDADNGETVHKSTSDTKCSPSTMTDKLPKSQPDSTDHVVPSSAHPSPRKDSYLFSPSKPNNLTKTRDYSRLRSPSASPRKRNNRTQSRSSSATKKLLFPADERGAKTSANTELESFLDFPKNSFLEVNIDDNFILDRNEDCVITSASVETSRPAAFSPTIRKKLNNSHVISPSVSKHTSKLEPTAAAQPLVESVQAEPAHPKPDAGADSHEPSVSFARVEKFASNEKLQENTNSERSQATGKSRTVRSGCFSSTEEKENDPADLARNKRLENIELGKADFSYRLVGIVNHHGESLYAGHYTAFAYNLSKQKWFYMDDRHTKETTEMTARRDSLNSGYVFFYMDKDLFHEYAEKVGETSAAKFQS